jgi:hypothetical protein
MKQLIIVGEGQTEQAFCKDVLYDHFFRKEIIIHNPTIKKTRGGIVGWQVLKKEIESHLKCAPKAVVTTLIDFYGLKDNHFFPLWHESKNHRSIHDRITILEEAMKNAIDESIRHRFIPYIQVYEFEALLFSDATIFETQFEKSEFLDFQYLQQTLLIAPEEINDGPTTAPSKRLERIIKGYKSEIENNKVFYGTLMSQVIGLERICEKCPRFNQWIHKLENI